MLIRNRVKSLWTAIAAAMLFIVFYAPTIGGRDYSGLIFLYLVFIFLLVANRVKVTSLSRIMMVHALLIFLLDIINLFNQPASYTMIARSFVYSFFPLAAYLVGLSLEKFIDSGELRRIILGIGVIQSLVGVLQVHSTQVRVFTLEHYANFDKYVYGFENWSVGRVVGTIGNPNTYGVFIAMFIVFLITGPLRDDKRKKVHLVYLGLATYALILSQSRTAYLLLTVGVYLSYLRSFRRLSTKLVSAILLSTVIVGVILYSDFIVKRFTAANVSTLGGRFDIWRFWVDSFFLPIDTSSLFGHGSFLVRSVRRGVVDNYYLMVLIQFGIIGLISYMYLNISILRTSLRLRNEHERNFITIAFLQVLISDLTGTVNMHFTVIISLYFLLGFYHAEGGYYEHITNHQSIPRVSESTEK